MLVASGLAALSRMVEGAAESAVVFDEFGDVVLYNSAAARLAGAHYVDPTTLDSDALPFPRAILGEDVLGAAVLLAVPGREKPLELIASLRPICNPLNRIVA